MNSLISSNNLLLQWALLLLPLIPLPLMILANLGESSSISRSWPAVSLQARKISWLLIGLIALLSGLAGLLYLGTPDHKAMAVAMLLGAVPAGLMLWPRFRLALSRLMPIDPESPLHGIAVALSAVFVAYSAGSALSEGLQSALSNPQHLQFWDLLFSEAPFLLAAVIGVGFLIRRSGHETRLRLGLTKPSWIQALLGLFCAGIFFTFSNGTDLLAQHLTPGLSQQINTVSNDLFGSLSRQPLGIVAIALSAGIAEEIFFRGALQP
ncbi:MAG: hypothetical protein ACREN8_14265, partial [Candidatus Dormibacteraceae bacterium]